MTHEDIVVGAAMVIAMACFLLAATHKEGTATGRLMAWGLFAGVASRFVALVL